MPFAPIPLSPYSRSPSQAKTPFPDNYVDMVATCLKNTTNAHDHKDGTPVPFIAHRTDFPAHRTEDGYAIGSAFYENGGLNQDIDIGNPHPLNAVNVHFAVQGTVADHVEGKWAGRKYTIYAPLTDALQSNGLPETLLTADTAFVSTERRVDLPGAHMIEDVPAGTLDYDFLQTAKDGHTLMAGEVNHQNKNSALRQLEIMRDRWAPRSPAILMEHIDDIQNNRFSKVDMSLMRDVIGANLLRSAPDFYFGEKKKEGFLSMNDGAALAALVNREFSGSSHYHTSTDLHTGCAGDRLRHPENLNKDDLIAISKMDNVHPSLRDIAEQWVNSDTHSKLRGQAIAAGLRTNDMMLNTYPEATVNPVPQHFSFFFSKYAETPDGKTALYGTIKPNEAEQIFKNHLTQDEREKVIQHVQTDKDMHSSTSAARHADALAEKLNELHKSACVQEMCDDAKRSELERRSVNLKKP